MPLIDPYSTLAVPKELAAQFLGVFARTGYVREDSRFPAAAWQRLANDAGGWVQFGAGDELELAIAALTVDPPRQQALSDVWQAVPLPGAHRVAQAVNAAVRVRNNLFHGGKHTPEAALGRDEALVRAALTVLTAVVEQCPGGLCAAYNNG